MILSQSSKAETDPLSEVLGCLGAQGARVTRLEAAGEWGLCFPPAPRLKFITVVRGRCWLLLFGRSPIQLSAGDICVLGCVGYAVASDPSITPVDGTALYGENGSDSVRLGGDDTVMLGGGIAFANDGAEFLFDGLPQVLLISPSSPSAAAAGRVLEMLATETDRSSIGGALVNARLAEILLVEAIRAYVDEHGSEGTGWIAALGDSQIGKALRLVHASIAQPWTVALLAKSVGMSRSSFSARFTQRVGQPPLDYIRQWRMVAARQALAAGNADVASVAEQVGYTSQSAFGHAFKRCFGHSPRQHR